MTKIKITGTNNPHYWYANLIGEVYTALCYYDQDRVYLVKDNEGYYNIVHQDNCEIVKDNEDDQ